MHAQTWEEADERIATSLQQFFDTYRIDGYVPTKQMKATDVLVDTRRRVVRIVANEAFIGQPMQSTTIRVAREKIREALPSDIQNYSLEIVDEKGQPWESWLPAYRGEVPDKSRRTWQRKPYPGQPWTQNVSNPIAPAKGLTNHHLCLWASHGAYFDGKNWLFQRPSLFGTCEDLFTQSIVYPFLVPMLENAGAIVFTPRERDKQQKEVIVDNDDNSSSIYLELASNRFQWQTLSIPGFASHAKTIADTINPFTSGTARQVHSSTSGAKSEYTVASWAPDLPEDGYYAVYVSYTTVPGSINDAHYTVYHNGMATRFLVNQQMGGSTWVYLGTFFFKAGLSDDNKVELSNMSQMFGIVTADAVRFGGGMGNVDRGMGPSPWPRFVEGARYWTQWAGMPYEVFSSKQGRNDYADDINTRSYTENLLSGGSLYHPSSQGRHVPIELSLALHSDAGRRYDTKSIYGTLAICTTRNDSGSTQFQTKVERVTSRDFASLLLDQVCHDLTKTLGQPWSRRELWDRNYSETRLPEMPSAILEMLSHQNYADMKLGHDPNFKFALARSIYKAILKYLSFYHQKKNYVVQPLPVSHFSALLGQDSVRLSWRPRVDSLDPSAMPDGYIVYMKVGDGNFNNGVYVQGKNSFSLAIRPNTLYSYKVCAVNAGGKSFPSETLTVYRSSKRKAPSILIVNGFDLLSGPKCIETPDSAGFDLKSDMGVPYYSTTAFSGYQYLFSPRHPDWGASGLELAGREFAGNTFDYPFSHGKAILSCGDFSFSSCSREAFVHLPLLNRFAAIDLIEGLQRSLPYGLKRYKTFDTALQQTLEVYCLQGGHLFVSGAFAASDMSSYTDSCFFSRLFHCTFDGSHYKNATSSIDTATISDGGQLSFYHQPNRFHYAPQSLDRLRPIDKKSKAFMQFADGTIAGVYHRERKYRTVVSSIPLECCSNEKDRNLFMQQVLQALFDH